MTRQKSGTETNLLDGSLSIRQHLLHNHIARCTSDTKEMVCHLKVWKEQSLALLLKLASFPSSVFLCVCLCDGRKTAKEGRKNRQTSGKSSGMRKPDRLERSTDLERNRTSCDTLHKARNLVEQPLRLFNVLLTTFPVQAARQSYMSCSRCDTATVRQRKKGDENAIRGVTNHKCKRICSSWHSRVIRAST